MQRLLLTARRRIARASGRIGLVGEHPGLLAAERLGEPEPLERRIDTNLVVSQLRRRLVAATRAEVAKLGLTAINATIRADNVGGLAYNARMGFVGHEVRRAVPLRDGTPVDRIGKWYALDRGDALPWRSLGAS